MFKFWSLFKFNLSTGIRCIVKIKLITKSSIVPCSIIIPPPNFQKKSEILKISDNNLTLKVALLAKS